MKYKEALKFKEISRPYWRDQAEPEIGNTALEELCGKQFSLSYCLTFWRQEGKTATVLFKMEKIYDSVHFEVAFGYIIKQCEARRDAKGT